MSDIHVGLLGPGKIADRYLIPALARVPGARFWSVLSRDAARAAEFAARHHAASPLPAYTDVDAMLADPALHAVIIATPDGLHAEQAAGRFQNRPKPGPDLTPVFRGFPVLDT